MCVHVAMDHTAPPVVGVQQWRRQDVREGGAILYAREIFDHTPSLSIKVEVQNVVQCAF